jgi:aspartyl protease family protein
VYRNGQETVMLARTLFFAAAAIVLALVVSQVAPGWLAVMQPAEQSVSAEIATPPPAAAPQPAQELAQPARGRQVALRTGPDGHVLVDGLVNDRTVRFLIDTGATTVVLNETTARRLGFRPSRSDFTHLSRTANGDIPVAPIRIGEIRIANITVRDVQAVIIPGDALDGNLLGMSFLKRLRKFEFQGDNLVLTQ